MIAFLTSSFVPYYEDPEKKTPLINENGFLANLKKYWTGPARFLVVASDPDDYHMTDETASQMETTFSDCGLRFEGVKCLDHRNSSEAESLVSWSNVLFLSGGHGPTENRFINEIGLKELLKNYHGIFLGLSAGSVNAADMTFQIPEYEEEVDNPDFSQHMPGLSITPLNIIPHAAYFKDLTIKDKDFYEDILIPGSHGEKIFFIEDGSYFLIDGGITEFFGKGEIIEDGSVRAITSTIESEEFDALMSQGYACAFSLFPDTGLINFKYMSPYFKEHGISPSEIPNIEALVRKISDNIIVDEEKEEVKKIITLDFIKKEVETHDSFSVTFHYLVDGNLNSADFRVRKSGKNYFGFIYNNTETIDHDWMTDIFSRMGFIKAAEKFILESDDPTKYSLVYTNIRGFKTINDLFGQQSGDLVIFQVRDLIKEVFNPDIFCRLENDHFAFLTENKNLVEKNFEPFKSRVYEEKYRKYTYTIRLGISEIESNDTRIPDLIDRARIAEKSIRDDAVLNWKKLDHAMKNAYVRRGAFVSEINDAVKDNEFKTYYQPIVDTNTGVIISAESLIRWQHHKLGMISPGEFIPLFEEEGKTPILDTFMLKSVADFQEKRFVPGKPIVPVSVNLSRIDFFDTLLIEDARKLFSSINFPAPMIKLEVTESAYADIEEKAFDFLRDMKSMGVKILLDDYGSGMSSLSTLESFEFDTVKLDMGFIRKIGKSRAAESIIRSTIALAHDLGSDTIAEGVENKEQLDFLKDAGCEMIQGYYFYKPVPGNEFYELLDKRPY